MANRIKGIAIEIGSDTTKLQTALKKEIDRYDDGTVAPYKLTFVLKGMDNRNVPDAKNRYKNLHKQAGWKLQFIFQQQSIRYAKRGCALKFSVICLFFYHAIEKSFNFRYND